MVLAVVLTIGLLGMVALASPADDGSSIEGENVTPGESVSGAVAAGDAEVQSDIEIRAFGHELQAADSPEERAELIAERLASDEATLDELNETAEELEAELEAGNITHGQYLAELTRIAVQGDSIERAMNMSANAAEGLDDELHDRGVSRADIDDLRDRASAEVPGLSDGIPGLDEDRPGGPPVNITDDDGVIPDDPGNESEPPDDTPSN